MRVNVFIRKRTSNFQNSIERFAKELKKNSSYKNIDINIIECPVESKGFINRLYLIIWASFLQGDINHILGDINYINLLMNKKKTISTYLDCRLLYQFKNFKKYIYKLFWFSLPIQRSKFITFISKFTKKEILRNLNISRVNYKVIPVPLVSNLSFKINKNFRKKVLIVGTLPHKNIKNMLLCTEGLNISVTVVGEIDEEIKKICRKAKINFKNYVGVTDNKMKNLYEENDILLMASNYEGFGMPIIEAQASGMVVITSKKEPMKSVGGECALLVDPQKKSEIKKMLKKIINNDKLFVKLAKKGLINTYNYKSSIIVKKYYELYLNLFKINNY